MDKIRNFIKSRTNQDWISIGLWLSTLVMLLTFVIYDAVAKGIDTNASQFEYFATNMAILGIIFGLVLMTAIVVTVAFAFLKRKRGG